MATTASRCCCSRKASTTSATMPATCSGAPHGATPLCLCSALWLRPLRRTGPCSHGARDQVAPHRRPDSCGAACRAAQAGGAPQAVQRVAVLCAAQLRGPDYTHPVPRDHVHGPVLPARPPPPSPAGACARSGAPTHRSAARGQTTNPVQARRERAGARAAGASRRAAAWRRRAAWRARSCSPCSARSAWR
jgi:hypothetical protein